MIKPEDIPCGFFSETLTPLAVAAILNAAIEAGIVSPPCWVVLDGIGDIVTHRRVFTSNAFAVEDFGHRLGYVIEHWKGQSE